MDTPTRERIEALEARVAELEASNVRLKVRLMQEIENVEKLMAVAGPPFNEVPPLSFRDIKDGLSE